MAFWTACLVTGILMSPWIASQIQNGQLPSNNTPVHESEPRVVVSNIDYVAIFNLVNNHLNGSESIMVPGSDSTTAMFNEIVIGEELLAILLGVPSVRCADGSAKIIQMDRAWYGGTGESDPSRFDATTFAFHYNGSWYMRGVGVVPYDPEITLKWILQNAS